MRCNQAIVEPYRRLEIDKSEHMLVRQLRRIGIPKKKTVNRAGIVGHEAFEIEDSGIVLGRLDADVVQRGSIAEVILRGIGVSMEHIP